jgi:MFS family permease
VRAAVGLGEGVAPSAATDMVARVIAPEERSRAISFIFGGLHVGSLLGLLVAPVLIDRFGWQTVRARRARPQPAHAAHMLKAADHVRTCTRYTEAALRALGLVTCRAVTRRRRHVGHGPGGSSGAIAAQRQAVQPLKTPLAVGQGEAPLTL